MTCIHCEHPCHCEKKCENCTCEECNCRAEDEQLMVVAETLFGLQLVQQSCKAIKMALKTTEDVSEIAGLIDNVFKGQEQLKKKAHPIASKWGGLIKGVTSDNFLQMAITETIQ